MGIKLWSTNELLTASDVNTYLMKQTVIVCTSGTHPSTPVNGMYAYETDTARLMKYNGSAWEAVGSSRTTSYTPTLTATITPPTLGSGSVRSSWYAYLPGPSIFFTWYIKFGTSGVAGGSGNYQVSLPVTAAVPFGSSNHSAVGSVQLGDSSSGATNPGSCFVDPSAGTNVGLVSPGGTVSTSSPWTWAASDYISGSIIYPI